MARHIQILAVVLAVQLVAIAGGWFFAAGRSSEEAERLLELNREAVTAVEIAENADTRVRIEKGAGGWTLPGLDGLPADAEKVTGLFDKLEQAEAAWPVATSETSARRFEVTPEKYQRRIRLFEGDAATADLYIGTSPGFRKVHARRADSNDIFAITFAVFEAPTKLDEWLDKTLLQPEGEVQSVARDGGWGLAREGESWKLNDLAEGEATDADAARDVVSKLANLRILGRAESSPGADAKPVFAFTLGDGDGTTTLRFFRPDAEGDFVVASDRREGFFRVAGYVAEALDLDRTALLKKPDAAPAEAEAEAGAKP